jgi:hypothetical protein
MQEGHENHIRARIGDAVVSVDPFPHLYICDILPAEIYETMARDTPGIGFCQVLHLLRTVAGLQPDIDFDFRMHEHAPASLRPLARTWEHKYRPYIDLIDRVTIEKLRPEINGYLRRLADLGCKTGEPPKLVMGQALFCHRSDGWAVDPYLHGVSQIVENTISVDEQGILFHKPKRQIRIPTGKLNDNRNFRHTDLEDTNLMPYRANTLVSVLNTPFSIRSTGKTEGPNLRYILSSIACDVAPPPAPGILMPDDFRFGGRR